ncbi:MAG TPA: serine hydrolase [Bacteroidetes bacterium]|nr:serine hydrolase [Bacteroidota bacterium]
MIQNPSPLRKLSPVHLLLLLAFHLPLLGQEQSSSSYYPPSGDRWEQRPAEALGMNTALLDSAIRFQLSNESKYLVDLREQLKRQYANDPYNETIGPTKERGGANGLVIRHGYIAAEWGDTRRVDMTFSVTKSFLSASAGLAYDKGLIKDLHDPVRNTVNDGGFDSPHNATITWQMLLQQTSEWEGTLWGKPDLADRRRGRDRVLQEPGTFWEYNDIRVNRTALALLRLFKKPLPQVLKEEIMEPIGASTTWEYHGYDNSDVLIEGVTMKSVSGGGHYGGGWWVSSRDQARFGLLYLRNGKWNDRQLLSQQWISMSLTPCSIRPVYGFLWWLNTEKKQWAQATERTFAALGAGTNAIVVVPEHDLVIVVRWIDTPKLGDFIGKVLASVEVHH